MLKEQDVNSLSILCDVDLTPSKSSFRSSSSLPSELCKVNGPIVHRKRNRDGDYDVQSLAGLSYDEQSSHSHKKKRRLSILSLVSFVKDSPRGAKSAITRSFSFTKENQMTTKFGCVGTPQSSYARKSRILRPHIPLNWVDVVGEESLQDLKESEVKRQEAIYSLLRTEMEMVEDLKMVMQVFYHPMLSLNLLTPEEHCLIFGCINLLLPLHEDLVQKLHCTKEKEIIDSVGSLLQDWFPTLSPYVDYCSNLVVAKRVLEEKKSHPAVIDFLQRCLESEFSRKIDLWTFLDSPRSRLMKYPILIKEIKRLTPKEHLDQGLLLKALESVEALICKVDSCTGITKCKDTISRLEYIFDHQRLPSIESSQYIICNGMLKSKNGTKLQAFLFDKAFVLTRVSTRNAPMCFQVYRNPIPVEYLVAEAVDDGDIKASGSFRGAVHTPSATSKHFIRVSSSNPGITRHCYILQASSEYDKRVWMESFWSVIAGNDKSASNTKAESVV